MLRISTASAFIFLTTLARARVGNAAPIAAAAAAVDLCPKVNNIGHADPETWAFSNLNWTLTQRWGGVAWPPPDDDFDESAVSFDLESAFNNAPVSCGAEGKEFSEEYTRQLAGLSEPVYNWYTCKGDSKDVKTEFKMVWWNAHSVEVRQTWACPKTGRPMRATGMLSFGGQIQCEFSEQSYRTQCLSTKGSSLPFDATIVEVLPPPPRNCAAASKEKPNWKVLDLVWTTTHLSTPYFDYSTGNMSFRLTNDALDGYSPLMTCVADALHQQVGVSYPKFGCGIFEANDADVPPTSWDFVHDDKALLSIDQTWVCDYGGSNGTRFHSIGGLDLNPILNCKSVTRNYDLGGVPFPETITTCVPEKDFEVMGKLQ